MQNSVLSSDACLGYSRCHRKHWKWQSWDELFLRPKECLKKGCSLLLSVCKHEGSFVKCLRSDAKSSMKHVKPGLYMDKWNLKSLALAKAAIRCFLSSTSKVQWKGEILKF